MYWKKGREIVGNDLITYNITESYMYESYWNRMWIASQMYYSQILLGPEFAQLAVL